MDNQAKTFDANARTTGGSSFDLRARANGNEKIILSGLLPNEITNALKNAGLQDFQLKSYNGTQIFEWISKGARAFSQMTNLKEDLRSLLSRFAILRSSEISKILKDPDGTIKLQITLCDNLSVETVLLTDKAGRKTACVSCQAGCAMNCAFCKTGTLSLARSLSAGEIVEQFLFLEETAGTLDNIVFMGMGEPMMNLENVKKSILILTDKRGRNLSAKRITISTCGVIKGIYDLADFKPAVRLAVSLTTADSKSREKLMPVAKTNPLPELRKAIDFYAKKTGKRVTLEAALFHDTNTDSKNAENMIDFARGLNVNINLIPWNPVEELDFEEPSSNECKRFLEKLSKAGLNVTLRVKRGRKIGGACGQLGKTCLN